MPNEIGKLTRENRKHHNAKKIKLIVKNKTLNLNHHISPKCDDVSQRRRTTGAPVVAAIVVVVVNQSGRGDPEQIGI